MTTKYYREWDWEIDQGVRPLEDVDLPANHATAFFDYWGRLYRVVVVEGDSRFVYDYFCDAAGRILEKRSVSCEDATQVIMLVRFVYDDAGSIREIAWWPDNPEDTRTHDRRDAK